MKVGRQDVISYVHDRRRHSNAYACNHSSNDQHCHILTGTLDAIVTPLECFGGWELVILHSSNNPDQSRILDCTPAGEPVGDE